jgi:ferredoxin--NADP+ reductase
MSIIRDPDTYERFEQVILVHGVRTKDELAYHDLVTEHLPAHEFLGDMISSKLRYYPTVTRETYKNMGRVTSLMESGKIFADLGLPALDPEHDRIMICGSPALVTDTRVLLNDCGFTEGNHGEPAHFVVGKAFTER